jgi:hypothetical protein
LRRDGISVRQEQRPIIPEDARADIREQEKGTAKLTRTTYAVAYSLGIYLLNLFLAFISPKFDPSLESDTDMEDGMPSGTSSLPTKSDEEFKPFVRRLPEFKFWHSATRAVCIAFACSWSEIFNLPVFWPVLVVYWLILVFLTMRRQIQSMIKYRYVFWECSWKLWFCLVYRFADFHSTDTCHGTSERPSTRALRSKGNDSSFRSNKTCLRLPGQGCFGGFILFNEHFSMVGGHERA